ncbi:hypothetical protein [Kitasatospora sp. NPDC093102]|uniref:hypothetical protein n=1 Tax=Kitasatospora sp. NPDC093102 TaxID=3155069 RepID=UPI00342DFBB0
MAASLHAPLGPLPAAPHHRRTSRRSPGRAQRLIAAAVLGLTLPLAAASAAVALPSPAALPLPVTLFSPEGRSSPEGLSSPGAGTSAEPSAEPSASRAAAARLRHRPRRPLPRSHLGGGFPQAHRHHLASLPGRSGAAVEQPPDQAPAQGVERAPVQTSAHAPDQAPAQGVERAPGQVPDQAVEQAPGQAPAQSVAERPEADAEAGIPGGAASPVPAAPDTVAAAAGEPVAPVAAVPALFPARWQDASTTQLPLGVGLGLIGCGLGLVGLRLRKG